MTLVLVVLVLILVAFVVDRVMGRNPMYWYGPDLKAIPRRYRRRMIRRYMKEKRS